MNNLLRLAVIVCYWLSFALYAQLAPPIPSPPILGAKSFLLQDFNSGQILAEENADSSVEPASLTKLMTAYVVFKELKANTISLTDQVTVSEKAWRTTGSRMFIEVDSKVLVGDLLKGMIVQSGNDATVALAEHVAGSESSFVALMNQYATELGLTGTHFENSSGLPAKEHYVTARDIARITRTLIQEFPEYYKWYSLKEFSYNGITQYNRNKLLWRDESVDGVKTGHTDSAGYCLVTSAQREDMRLISVVLGSNSKKARADASQSLLNYGFRFFKSYELHAAGTTLAETRVWKGASESLPIGLEHPLYVTVPRRSSNKLDANMLIDKRIVAPVDKGQQIGWAQVTLDNVPLTQQRLVALKDIPEGSFWQRVIDEVLLYFE
ncbi:MAG: D-alanyl-D-alanine carboxypeptidase family protein [Gammaproteobacteria bacterium]